MGFRAILRGVQRFGHFLFSVGLVLSFLTMAMPRVLINSYLVGVTVLGWLLMMNYGQRLLQAFKNPLFWSVLAIYLVRLAEGVNHWGRAIFMTGLERNGILVVGPLLLFAFPKDQAARLFRVAFVAFAAGMLLMVGKLYVNLLFGERDPNLANRGHNLMADVVPFNGTYFTLYLGLVALAIFIYLLKNWNTLLPYFRLLLVFIFGILVVTQVLVAAMMPLISFVLVCGIFFLRLGRPSFGLSKLQFHGLVSCAIIAGFALLMAIPSSRNDIMRLVEGRWEYQGMGSGKETSISIRREIWPCAWEVFENNWATGVGYQDMRWKLNKCYQRHEFLGWWFKYNTHNQFLHELVCYGLFGGIIFLAALGLPLFLAWRNQRHYLLAFMGLIFLCCITENIFMQHKGAMLYGLMFPLLAMLPSSPSETRPGFPASR